MRSKTHNEMILQDEEEDAKSVPDSSQDLESTNVS